MSRVDGFGGTGDGVREELRAEAAFATFNAGGFIVQVLYAPQNRVNQALESLRSSWNLEMVEGIHLMIANLEADMSQKQSQF